MATAKSVPSFRPATVALVMLSLSIGWGIRGNFGHEFGAMLAGTLAGIAVCLFSGREDWRRRVAYFAFFGALGWGFGGSIAYMPALCYSQSGHLPTQFYGFFSAFTVGFLWASMGGAGTAYPAVEEREKLTQLFKPLCWVFALWTVQYFCEDSFVAWYERTVGTANSDTTWFRQRNPFYWLDSEWLEASTALIALCLFDLWDRRFGKLPMLGVSGAAGALAGFVMQKLLAAIGLLGPILHFVVQRQGDLAAIDPVTKAPFNPENLMTNWPQVFFDFGDHLGLIFGLIAGIGVYFYKYGKWRSGSSLLMHMTLGSFAIFLIFPVFLSDFMPGIGGFRLQPPRGDSWANTIGVLVGALIYAQRNKLYPVTLAALVSGFIGGLGLMTAQIIKTIAFMPGNPLLTQNEATIKAWAHWHSANWHSICTEQGAGLLYGLGIAVAMGMLATRTKPLHDDPPARRWTEAFSVSFILNVLLYVNLVKCVEDWTREQAGGFRAVPLTMKMPLVQSIAFSSETWFLIFFLLMTACTVALLAAHLRRPLAVVPVSWLGKGQMFFLVFLWAIVIGNFTRALTGFGEQRLATEGLITVNALIVTFLILYCAREKDMVAIEPIERYGGLIRKTVFAGVVLFIILDVAFTGITHGVYGNRHDGWGGRDLRFGPEADWRVKPIMKNKQHK